MEQTATLLEPIAASATDPKAIEDQINQLVQEIEASNKRLAALRKQLPETPVQDYPFAGPLGESVKLSQLFGDKSELILIHNMGRRCTYCTLWADGFNGLTKHLENRAAFVVASPDDPETQRTFAIERGWTFRMYSTKGTTFRHDMGFEPTPGETWPGVSVFRKDEAGNIYHVSKASFGPGDPYNPLWHLLDLLPTSDREWHPDFRYDSVK